MNPYDEALDDLGQPPQTAPARPTNPYVQTLQEMDKAADTKLRQSLITAEQQSPDTAREALQLSKRTGLPVDVIERNMDAIRKRAKIVDTPYAQMLRETPVLAEFVAESPAVAAAVQDDMEQLGFLEWLTQAPGRAFNRGQAQVRFGQLSAQQLYRTLTAAEREQLAADKAAMQAGGQLGTGQSWFRGAITGAAQQLPNLFGAFLSGARHGIPAGITAGTGAALAGQLGPQVALPEELITVPLAFGGGFTAGTMVGAGQFGFELEAGLALDEYLDFKDEFGQTIDPDVARAAALATGAMNAGLEAVGLGVLLKTVPGLKNLVAGPVTRSAVKQALRQPSVRAALAEAMKTYGTALSSETAVEMAQRAVTIMSGELAKLADDKNIAARSAGDIVQDIASEGYHALQAFSLLALPGPATSFALDVRKANQAKHNERFFTALGEGIAQSKTATELPDAAIAFLERATKDGPVETLYQPVETWAQYWQDQGVDPREMATELTGDSEAFDRALRTGEDLAIPTARYAVKLAATDHNAFFAREIRLGPEEMNARESEAFEAQMKGQSTPAATVQPLAGAVKQIVVEQLVNAGVPEATADTYAQLYENVFGTLAERAGMDAQALFERYGLTVRRAGLNDVEGTASAAPAGAVGGSAITPASATSGAPGAVPETVRGEGSGGTGPTVPTSPADVMAAGVRAAVAPLQDVPGAATLSGDGPQAADLGALESADLDAANAGLGAAATGGGLPDDVGQLGSAGAVGDGTPASGGTDAPVRGRDEIPPAHAAYFDELLADARANGFTGSDDSLADRYLAALDDAQRAADDLNATDDDQPTAYDLLKKIVDMGGFGIEEEAGGSFYGRKQRLVSTGGMVGELEDLMESLTKQGVGVVKKTGRTMSRQMRRVGKLPGGKVGQYVVTRKGGNTADAIFEGLNEDGRWTFESLADMLEAVREAVMIETGQMKPRGANRYTPESILDQVFDVRPGTLWWAPPELLDPVGDITNNASGESAASLEAISRDRSMRERGETFVVYDRTGQRRPLIGVDAVDYVAQDGETYGIEGPQGFQVLDDRGGRTPAPREDVLSTGEVQPRLPGDVGAVRDQEAAQPQLGTVEDRFDLTAPPETDPSQTELFQPGYHGSPHIFDKFSLHAIGTGEGNQAYGWGLYFASRREVAEWYRNTLTQRSRTEQVFALNGESEQLSDHDAAEVLAEDVANALPDMPRAKVFASEMSRVFMGYVYGNHSLKKSLELAGSWFDKVENQQPDLSLVQELRRIWAAFERAVNERQPKKVRGGRTYTVELPESDEFLDWDMPLESQSPKVKAVLRELGFEWSELGDMPSPKDIGLRIKRLQNYAGPRRFDLSDAQQEALRMGSNLANLIDLAKAGTPDDQLYQRTLERLSDWWKEHHALIENVKGVKAFRGDTAYYEIGRRLHDEADGVVKFSPERLASERLAKMGLAGIKYTDGSSRGTSERHFNFVVFDDSLVQITEFDQAALPAGTKLSALHQLTAENLAFADKLGGLPVPSLAVTPDGSGALRGYGDITLIGAAPMVDPTQVPVFDADVYSQRFPDLLFKKAKEATVRKLTDALRPFAEKYDEAHVWGEVYDNARGYGGKVNPSKSVSRLIGSMTGKAAFLASKGITVDPVMAPKVVQHAFVERPVFRQFIAEHGAKFGSERPGSEWWRAMSDALVRAVEQEAKRYKPSVRSTLVESFKRQWLDEDGQLHFGYSTRIQLSLEAIGAEQVDRTETEAAIDKALKGREVEFHQWVSEAVMGMHGEPLIMLGRRQVPMTLANVVEAMTGRQVQGVEKTMTFGEGKARAVAARRITSATELRTRAESQIAPQEEVNAAREQAKQALEQWRNAVLPYYSYTSTWDALDASMESLAKWAGSRLSGKSESVLRAALRSNAFANVPEAVVRQGVEAGELWLKAPVPYFEAKPQRAVLLSEFPGAIIPNTATDETRAILARNGVVYEEYDPNDATDRDITLNRLRARLAADRDDVLFQKRRGYLRFGADRKMNIGLLEEADLSTFLHESGHFYLEVFGDVVDELRNLDSRTSQQADLVADYEALLEWLGVETRAQIGRDQHEQFARGFEAYLMTGEAPNIGLHAAFAKFRAWLIGVYRSLRALNVQLSDKVIGVFDRLIATDNAISQAEQLGNVQPMFTTAASAGMTEEQFALYREAVAAASQRAREQLDGQLLAEVQRELTAEWKARRGEVEAAVTAEVHARPVYQALAAMRTGRTPDGQPLLEGLEPEPLKLSRAVLVDRFGVGRIKRLPKPFIYTVDGGMDPDIVADMFGFSSADEMLQAVEQAAPARDVIAAETERRMLAEHGAILLDGTLHERATAAIANDDRDRIIRAEMRALGQLRRIAKPFVQQGERDLQAERRERAYERRWLEAEAKLRVAIERGEKQAEIDELMGEVRSLRQKMRGGAATIRAGIPPDATIRQSARERIAGTKVRALKPQPFWAASRRAAQLAIEAAARGDFEGAIVLKQQELMNIALFREASDALADVEARVKKARELAKPAARQRLGLAGESYLDQVDGILDRFNFAKVSQKALDRRATIAKWAAEREAEGLPVELSDEILDDVRRVPYSELTVEALVGVTDGLDQIVHLARLKNRLLKSQQQRELDAVVTEVTEAIREHKPRRRRQDMRDRGPAAERSRLVSSFFASHRKIASLAREMDGLKDGGPVWEAIIRPLNAAGDREATMNAEATKRLGDLINAAYPGADKRKLYHEQYIPEIGTSLSKMHRLMVALNWGNEGNRERVRTSEKWDDRQIEAVLGGLTLKDWQFVQGVLDLINSYWEEIAAKQQRVTGVAPTKVEATPIRTAFGEFAGGYFPIKYDDRLSATAAAHLDLDAGLAAKQAAYVKATTRRGHTKERVARTTLPLRLDFGVITEHLQQVVHDLSHHETLIDVSRILQDRRVQSAIFETYGDVVYKQFKDGIRDIAFGDVPAVNGFEKAMNHIRTGATIAGLGWSLTTAALQPLGLTQSMVRIGPRWVVKGLTRWLRDAASMENTVAWITERSAFMRERGRTQQREINEIRNTIGLNTGKVGGWIDEALRRTTFDTVTRQGVADSYFFLIQQLQRVADVPTWIGAYEKAMASGESEDRAVALADQAVIDAQAGGQIKDLAGVQRGGPLLKLWTNFYSFFNTTYNLSVESVRRTKFSNPAHLGRLAVDYVLLYSLPASLGYLLREGLQGGDDDDEQLLEGLIRDNLAYLSGTLLGFREFGGVIQGYAGYEGPAGARAFSAASRFARQVEQGELDAAFWRALNDTAGVLFHYPSGQVRRTIEGIAALAEGETENPAVLIGGPQR